MKKNLLSFTLLILSAVAANAQFASAPAFPGAEGYGRYVTGGRGGEIIHVTNLNDSGTGSLREAIQKSGKRIIVFDVSGTIALKSAISISKDDVTILGQTAPGDGICLANYALNFNANNIICRYIRCRMGDYDVSDSNESDAMSGSHHDNAIKTGTIIDHCSICWSIDECASFYGNKDFTFQWNYVTESMCNSGHSKGAHGYGGIWGGERASFHHNLLAHHTSRNARLDHDYVSTLRGPIDYVNNAFYNWSSNNTYGGESVKGKGFRKVNYIGNYYKAGPATSSAKSQIMNATSYCTNCYKSDGTNIEPAHLYLTGNVVTSSSAVTQNNWQGIITDAKHQVDVTTLKSDVPFTSGDERFNYNTISIQKADESFNNILKYGGCSFARDTYDQRIALEAQTGTCTYTGSVSKKPGIIDKPSDVGGYPILSTYGKLDDTDNDGIPDEWEKINGLNPSDAKDAGEYTLDAKGYYTNIEVYANSLVEADIKAARANAEQTFEEYYPPCKSIKTVTEETTLATGNIVWSLDDMGDLTDVSDKDGVIDNSLASYLDYVDVSLTDGFVINGVTTDTNGTVATQFKNNGSSTSTAILTFGFMPNDDVNIKLTGLEFYAGKNATDNDISVSAAYNNSISQASIIAGTALPRITSGGKAINALYHFNGNIAGVKSTTGLGQLVISFNNVPSTRMFAIGKIIANIAVTTNTTHSDIVDPSAIAEISATNTPKTLRCFNVVGQQVAPGTKGLIIRDGKKIYNK